MCASDTLPEHARAKTPLEEHLCRFVELAPVCVTRITVDGTFLAVNVAALALFGGERLDQVLDTSLLGLIAPEQREQCEDFLTRLAAGERRSAAFELTGFDRARRAVLLHAVPIPDPHDGIASAVCTCHVLTEQRRLEQAVIEASRCADEEAAARTEERARFGAVIELERRKASVALSEQQQRISQLDVDLAAARDELERRAVDHAQEIARLDALLARSAAEQQAIARQGVQALVDRQALELRLRRSERLAHAGRLAISIAGDLEDYFRTVSDRVRALLSSTDPGDERQRALTDIACAAIDGVALAQQIPMAARVESED